MDRNIRIGNVSSIDYKNGMIKVVYPDLDNTVTDDLPFATFNCEYEMPPIGADVLVLHLSNGQAAGIALGTYWNAENTPPGSGAGYYRKDFVATAIGTAFMELAKGNLTIHAPEITLSVSGDSMTVSQIIAQVRKCMSCPNC